jgi:hypothetical protein
MTPIIGAPMAMKSGVIVRDNLTNMSTFRVVIKFTRNVGRAGASVAPAMGVSVLSSNKINSGIENLCLMLPVNFSDVIIHNSI